MDDYLFLAHHGIKGMKWGVRRFQNKDGSLTEDGKARYSISKKQMKADIKSAKRAYRKETGEWMTTGKNVSRVDEKVSKELSSNKRRSEINTERDRLSDVIDKYESRRKDAQKVVDAYDDALSAEHLSQDARDKLSSERERARSEVQRHQDNLDIANSRYDDLSYEYDSIGRRVAEAHLAEYKRAVVADLGYKNIQEGVRMLEDYGLTNNALRWNIYRYNGV